MANLSNPQTSFQVFTGDGLAGLRSLPPASTDLVFTSPPYANRRAYARIDPDSYVHWFLPWAVEIRRVLKPTGSFVLNINDCVVQGERHLYVFDLVSAIRRRVGLLYIERYVWVKTAAFPGRFRLRFRDHTEYLFHFAQSLQLKIRHEAVKVPVTAATLQGVQRARQRAEGRRWSQSGSALSRDQANMPVDFALPGNVIYAHPETQVKGHPAPGPLALPDFFIRALTDPGDLVVDPFTGSGTTGVAATRLGRRFVGWEAVAPYADLARQRIAGSLGHR